MAQRKTRTAKATASTKRKTSASKAGAKAGRGAATKRRTRASARTVKAAAKKTGKSPSRTTSAKKTAAKKATTTRTTGSKRTAASRAGAKRTTKRLPASKATPARRTASKKTAPNPGPTAVVEETVEYEPPPPIPKTRLSDKQLQEFRDLLLNKRRELVGDVDNLTNEALHRSRSEACGDLSSMPIHMADIGSDNWEQEFTLGLISNERSLLRQIDEALLRIVNRTYGICLGTLKPISVTRLRAKPWAKYCIEYARLHEKGQAP